MLWITCVTLLSLHAACVGTEPANILLLPVNRPRLLIVFSHDSDAGVDQPRQLSQRQPSAIKATTNVRRHLGDLLSHRCRCDVRIDRDPEYNILHSVDRTDVYDIQQGEDYLGPSALIVIHSTPPPLEYGQFNEWLGSLRWQMSLMESAAAAWSGMERCVDKKDTEDNEGLMVYHVYFTLANAPLGLDTHR